VASWLIHCLQKPLKIWHDDDDDDDDEDNDRAEEIHLSMFANTSEVCSTSSNERTTCSSCHFQLLVLHTAKEIGASSSQSDQGRSGNK
jgi:hypothetical protein